MRTLQLVTFREEILLISTHPFNAHGETGQHLVDPELLWIILTNALCVCVCVMSLILSGLDFRLSIEYKGGKTDLGSKGLS